MRDAWDKWLSAVTAWYEDHPEPWDWERVEYRMPRDLKLKTKRAWWVIATAADSSRQTQRNVRKAVAETKRCEMLKSS